MLEHKIHIWLTLEYTERFSCLFQANKAALLPTVGVSLNFLAYHFLKKTAVGRIQW